MTKLTVRGLSGGYTPSTDVIQNLNFDIAPGQAIGMIGRNGAGKTCLAQLLMGAAHRSAGTISLDGRELAELRTHQRIRAGISLVPEGRMIFPQLTVRENLIVAAYGAGRKATSSAIAALEGRFKILGTKAHNQAGSMSGGEQQILAIARALIQKPSVIVLDEPSLGLAPVMVNAVGRVLAEVLADGLSILLMEQNRHLVAELCTVVHVVQAGGIALSATPAELAANDLVGDIYMGA